VQEAGLGRGGQQFVAYRQGRVDQWRRLRVGARPHRLGLPSGPLGHRLEDRSGRRLDPQAAQRPRRLQHRLGLGQRTHRHIGMQPLKEQYALGTGRLQEPYRAQAVPVRERGPFALRAGPAWREFQDGGGVVRQPHQDHQAAAPAGHLNTFHGQLA
jgi:hypothetical protein